MSEHSDRSEELHRAFQIAWDEFGDDASTEFLIAIVCDRCDAEHDEVTYALVEYAED